MMSAHFGTEVALECQKQTFRSLTSNRLVVSWKEMQAQFSSGKNDIIKERYNYSRDDIRSKDLHIHIWDKMLGNYFSHPRRIWVSNLDGFQQEHQHTHKYI